MCQRKRSRQAKIEGLKIRSSKNEEYKDNRLMSCDAVFSGRQEYVPCVQRNLIISIIYPDDVGSRFV